MSFLTYLLAATAAAAQTDEIQVYDGELAKPGRLNLTLHNNYTPSGIKTPAFPGAVVADGSWNGVPEFAYGVAPWFEAGLYLPLYTRTRQGRFELNGFKLRALFAEPEADKRNLFYGVNFEFSVNARHWDQRRYTGEVRPILGARSGPWTVIVNPIFDTDYTGVAHLDFAPATRVAYQASKQWTLAAETYSDFGQVRHFLPSRQQSHQLFGVLDYAAPSGLSIEFGAGVGLTSASDRLTLKLMLSKDLN